MTVRSPLLRILAAASLLAALGLTAAGAQVAIDPVPAPEPCLLIPTPLPSGVTQAPPDTFADPALFTSPAVSNDYHWMHSSVHLQGAPALQKFAACAFFDPDAAETAPVDMSDFRSALIVNNPSPTVTVTASIIYRDPQGNQLGLPQSITLGPEDTFVQGAIRLRQLGPGIGSIEVQANQPIVGATLHHFGSITLSDGQTYFDPDAFSPGEGSLQQLQMRQDDATTLYAGPFPASNSAAEDFLNGVLPLTCVLNPNPTPTTVLSRSFIAPNTPLTSQLVTLPPFGMLLDTSIWAAGEPFYLGNPAPFDLDVLATAISSPNPIVGDFLMVDVFGNGAPDNLLPGERMRMGSGMMQFAPALRLFNPEHVETGPFAVPGALPSTPPVETMMSIANVTGSDIGPVNVRFFNRTGGTIANVNIPSLPPGAVQRITPALFAIPENFAGWARVTACRPGLIGWTMREVMEQTNPFSTAQFRKVYGEELDGANGLEPGRGTNVTTADGNWIRKVAPLLRAGDDTPPPGTPPWWPGYVNAANNTASNIGQYWHRFFSLPGTLVGQQIFAGLRFANTSFTFVDPIVSVGVNTNISGRFDRATGNNAIAMEAIGDPLVEWGIPLFLGPDADQVLDSETPPQ